MGIDTEVAGVFLQHGSRKIRHLQKHQDINMTYHYVDTASGVEFDIRDLPAAHLGEDAAAVHEGDAQAHRRALRRALEAGHAFA